MGRFVYRTKYKYPDYKLKSEFTVGTYGENEWKLGETACVDRCYYRLPNGSEYAIFKFAERTRTGGKRFLVARRKRGVFVDVDPDAMTQTMAHLAREPAIGQHRFRMGVHFGADHARAHHGFALLVRTA